MHVCITRECVPVSKPSNKKVPGICRVAGTDCQPDLGMVSRHENMLYHQKPNPLQPSAGGGLKVKLKFNDRLAGT